jgi:hypothetical protein
MSTNLIDVLNAETALTTPEIAARTGHSAAWVLGFMSGLYSDPAAEDAIEGPTPFDVGEFCAGREAGELAQRSAADGSDLGAA